MSSLKSVLLAASASSLMLIGSAHAQSPWLTDWASQKKTLVSASLDEPRAEGGLFTLDAPTRSVRRAEASRQAATVALYGELFGRNTPSSYLWSGLETANPLTRDEGYRWDSLRDQGLFDPVRRAKLIAELQAVGVFNLRIGLSNHRIDLDDEKSWAEHDAMVADFAKAGVGLSLDLHHFGVEDRFRVADDEGRTIHPASYYLNDDWPDYFARFAAAAYERYGASVKAITIVNEPETTAGFNSEMWHGAFPGWGDERHEAVYIERALKIATAAVKARLAIEEIAESEGRRPLFMHTEAGVTKPWRKVFDRYVRFLPSDLILGQSWLLRVNAGKLADTPLDTLRVEAAVKPAAERTTFDWLVERYVLAASDELAEHRRDGLARMITELQGLHRELGRDFGKSMKTDTVFALDYYAHNEVASATGVPLSPEPQFYAEQVRAGERAGLYPLLVDYYNHYGMAMMIGETGTPFYYYGAYWHEQMLLEAARAMEEGVPMLGHVIYPLVDTNGWETGLSVARDRTTVNPGGILDGSYVARPFIETLLRSLDSRTAEHDATAEAVQ